MARQVICKLKNHHSVYFDPEKSHAATHLKDDPQLLGIAKEFLRKFETDNEQEYFHADIGRIVGSSDLVTTDDSDEVVYAKRKNRKIFTRFVKNRKPLPTRYVSFYLVRDAQNDYELSSIWIGQICPAFPGDEWETPESKPFWTKHALVWGKQEIQSGTVTSTCPW